MHTSIKSYAAAVDELRVQSQLLLKQLPDRGGLGDAQVQQHLEELKQRARLFREHSGLTRTAVEENRMDREPIS